MYTVNNKKYVNKGKILDKTEFIEISGFLMASKRKTFHIENSDISDIRVVNKKLARPLVTKKVLKQYNKLISHITDLLVDDDESGESCREALNQIEKFRLIIKNKYRAYLKKQELEAMSKQLKTLQKEANKRLLEIQDSYLEYMNTGKKGK